MLDDPSPPVTPPDTITEVGIVNVCATSAYVTSKIILPSSPELGKLENDLPTRHVRMQSEEEFAGWGS